MKKRVLSMITVLALCLTLLPTVAAAEGDPVTVGAFTVKGGVQDQDYAYVVGVDGNYDGTPDGNVLTIHDGADVTISMAEGVEKATTDRIKVDKNATVTITLDGVNIESDVRHASPFTLERGDSGNVTLNLSGENSLIAYSDTTALEVFRSTNLTINGPGSLTAQSSLATAIGSSLGATVTINSGTVNAVSFLSTGIGGGNKGTVTINGGTVTATGYRGIGNDTNCMVTINGGTVTAEGSNYPGIQGTFSTGENGTATIYASSTAKGYSGFSDKSNQSQWQGLIFDGNDGMVGGNFTLNSDLEIKEGQTLGVMGGAKLTIAEGKTLTNNGVLAIENADSITGTIAGDGTFSVCLLTQDMIEVPTGLVYDGTDKTEVIREQTRINSEGKTGLNDCGKDFTLDYTVWKQSITKNSEELYSVNYALGGITVGKEVNVEKFDHLVVEGGVKGTDYTYENTVLTVLTDTALTISDNSKLNGSAGVDRIEVAKDVNANIILAGVNIDVSGTENAAAFNIAGGSSGNVTVTLKEGTTNTLKSGKNCAGLQKNSSSSKYTLTINGTGSLNATGGENGAGIGGGYNPSEGIVIDSGTVTATGGKRGAGIGGGYTGLAKVTINGGTVKATAGGSGAGIGAGDMPVFTSRVTITGGTVEAIGSGSAAGIGGAGDSDSGEGYVSIEGGTVKATGGSSGGVGIGGGLRGRGSVTISGGVVTAIGGGSSAAGIGSGYLAAASGSFATGENGTAQIIATSIKDKSKQGEWKGLIFDGNAGFVGGEVTLSADLTIEPEMTLTIAEGAKLIIPADKALTNNGALIVWDAGSIDCQGTLTGDGAYKSYKLTADMILPPSDLIYEGEPLTERIKTGTTISAANPVIISEKTFAFAGDLWTIDVTQQDKTEYTITYSYSGMTVEKKVHTQKYNELEVTGGTLGTDFVYENGVLTVKTATPLTIRNKPLATTTTDRIVVAKDVDADVTLAGVNIDVSKTNSTAAFLIADNSDGDVTVRLAADTTNNLKSGNYRAGLQKGTTPIKPTSGADTTTGGPGTLTIEGPGALNAKGGNDSAGIGGGTKASGCNIIINGGRITAAGDFWGAGIGGGVDGVGEVTINGGYIDAKPGGNAAAIGGGFTFGESKVTINGGTVIAHGTTNAAAIGGGYHGHAEVTITGGVVKVTGGNGNARGIGSGAERYGSVVKCSDNAIIYLTPPEGELEKDCMAMAGYNDRGNWTCIIFGCDNDSHSYWAKYAEIGKVYGNVTLPQDLEITADGESKLLLIPAGTSLTVPADKTLTNNGTLRINYGGTLTCESALAGTGTFETENLTADLITLSSTLVANGQDRSADVRAATTLAPVTIGDKAFTVVGWTLSGVQQVDGSVTKYAITYTNDSDTTKTVTKEITLPKSGTQFVDEGVATAYNGDEATNTFTYGETITVKAKPTATGTPANQEQAVALFSLTAPTADQMALYLGEEQVSEAATKGDDGSYTMNVSVKDLVAAGATYGTPVTLTAKFVENAYMVDGQATVSVTLSKKALTASITGDLTKVYDGTAAFTVPTGNITLTGLEAGDDLTATASANLGDIYVGSKNFTDAAVTLAGAGADNYTCAALSGLVEITRKPLTVTAADQTIEYGGSIATDVDKVTCTGLASGDALTGITLSKTATAVGEHPGDITAADAAITRDGENVARNYNIAYTAGKLTINQKLLTATITGTTTKVYDGNTTAPAGLSITLDGTVNGDVLTAEATDYTYNSANVSEATTITANGVTLEGAAKDNYALPASITVAGTITKATPEVTAPTAITPAPTYNGNPQALVNAGTTTGGALQYSLKETEGYSTDIPEGTDAGTYTVWYKVVGGDNYYDVAAQHVDATIAKAAVTFTQPTPEAVTYETKLSQIDLGDNWAWENGETVPTVTNSGYVAYYTVPDYENYDWSTVTGYSSETHKVERTISLTVNKATPTVTAPEAKELHYTGEAQELVTAGTTTGGELQYKLGADGMYGPDIPTATEVGDYTVYYKVVGDSNYNDVGEMSLTVKIDKTAPDYQAPTAVEGLVYDGDPKELVENGSATGGTLMYAVVAKDALAPGDDAYKEEIPTATDAGEYTVYYKVIGDADHGDISPKTVNVTIAHKYAVAFDGEGVRVTSSNTGTFCVLFAAYKDGAMVSLKTVDVTFDGTGMQNQTVAKPAGFDDSGADTVKAFFWTGLSEMLPLCPGDAKALQ